MITFEIDTEYIELIKLLKATRIADSGAMAKILVENGEVTRNGEPEFRKRAKITKYKCFFIKTYTSAPR